MAGENDGDRTDVLDEGGDLEDIGEYPLFCVPDTIEPGVMMFTLWAHPPGEDAASYDFGFEWDGDTHAVWNCDGRVSGAGTADWSNGTDLELEFDLSPDESKTAVLEGAALDAIWRSEWVELANRIYQTLREHPQRAPRP